ncbi:MAG: Ig-like domain-containing protein, partial [Actinomycetota bacterium]|nr:Ig-like domain-containing protein [Actinomycetota bacterium]
AGEPDSQDTFTTTATDPAGRTATTTITVPVTALPTPDNQAPQTGLSGPWQIDEETGVVTATLGFTDPDGDPLTYDVTEQPDNGVVTIDEEAGTYTYTPQTRPGAGEPDGEDRFTVVASDPDGLTATNTIGLPVVALPDPGNSAPAANPDAYTLDEDTTLSIGGPGVLANDTDADSDPLTAVLDVGPDHGTFVLNADGSFSYTPDSGYAGTDSFSYTADDGTVASAPATVTLTVNPVNDPADLGNDTATVIEGSTGNVINVLANDSDPDGELTITATGTAANGTTAVTADGRSVLYTPASDYTGTDTFTYTVADPDGGTGTATVTVTVIGAANEPPVAGPPGEQTVILETGRVSGDLGFTDPEGAFLDYTVDSAPLLGTVTIDFLGNYSYTPDPENRPAFGEDDDTDTFTVTATDPAGASATTTITVPVVAELNAENQAPVAGTPEPLTVDAVTGEVSGNFDFFTDPDGDELSFTPIPGGYDSVITYADGTFTYIPSTASRLLADPGTTQTMTVIATDPAGLSATATIEIPIVPAQPTVVDSVDVGAFPANVAVSPDGSVVYVSNGGVTIGDSVTVVDPATNTVVDVITVGENPDGIVFDADGSTAYVVSADDGALVVIDPATGNIVDSIDLDNNNPREIALSPDGLRAYISANDFSTSSGVLMVDLDPESPTYRTVVDDFRIDEQGADGIAFDSTGDRLYVTTVYSVTVIDTDPSSPTFNTVVGNIEVGDDPTSIAIPRRGPFAYGAYVVNQASDTVSLVHLADGTEIDTIEVGSNPVDVAFTSDGSVAYVVNVGDETGGTLSVIDVENRTVIDTVALGFAPSSVAVGPDGTVYTTNAFDGTLSVIAIESSGTEV